MNHLVIVHRASKKMEPGTYTARRPVIPVISVCLFLLPPLYLKARNRGDFPTDRVLFEEASHSLILPYLRSI